MIVSSIDARALRALLQSLPRDASDDAAIELGAKIGRASIVEASVLPSDVITIDSAVVMRDVASGVHHYLLLLLCPEGRRTGTAVCVLEQLGRALLGRRVGEIIEWQRCSERRRMRIEAVQQPIAIRAELWASAPLPNAMSSRVAPPGEAS